MKLSFNKLTVPFLIGLYLLLKCAASAQPISDKTVTINPVTLTVQQLFQQLEQKAGLNFIYSSSDKDISKTITLNPAATSIRNLFSQISAQTSLKITLNGTDVAVQSVGRGSLKGSVQTPEGQAASFVTVTVKGTGKGTVTDERGAYLINDLPEGLQTVVFQGVGFGKTEKTVRIQAGETVAIETVQLTKSETQLDEVIVTASRKAESINEVPSSVFILNARQITEQTAVNSSISAILGNTIPGLGTATNKATNSGQTLRGRNVLILIDGIPQSTPLMNGARDMRTLDPAIIERVEVIKGATSIYGNGSGGGIINFITKSPGSYKPINGQTVVAGTGNLFHTANTPGLRVSQTLHGTYKKFTYVVNGTYNQIGVLKDAKGEVIGQDDGLGQTKAYNLYAKVGYKPTEHSELTLSYSLFSSQQYSDYVNKAGVYGQSPAIGVRGESLGEPAGTPHNHNAYLTYRLTNLPANTSLEASLYHHRFESMNRWVASSSGFYGAGQTQIQSAKKGLRLNLNTPWKVKNTAGEVTYGLDLLNDVTNQVLTDGRVYIPDMNMVNLAPYAQVKVDLWKHLILKGGARYENATVKVKDYNTLPTGPGTEGSIRVSGGSIPYHALMFNAGLRYTKFDLFNPFVSFSQGFAINELGRILRTATENTLGQLQTDPIITNNYEAGFSSRIGVLNVTAAYFISTSKLGANLVDVNGAMIPERDPEKVYGYELTADARLTPSLSLGGSYAYVEGKAEQEDGTWTYLTGLRIAPPKATAYVYYTPFPKLNLQLFMVHTGKRQRFEPRPNGKYANSEGPIQPVTLLNLNGSYKISSAFQAGLGVENLLNTAYYPPVSQYRAFDAEYVRGNGARLTLSLQYNF
ncbi:TonB-dependent siderophore receptor [Larkinella harenae]